MFKITVFSSVEPAILSKQLKKIRFHVNQKTQEISWEGQSGESFVITPFRSQSRNGLKGYRIHSDYPISTIIYLFKGALGWLNDLKVTGIEYEAPFIKSKKEHLKDCLLNQSLQTADTRGIFTRKDVMIVLLNDKMVLQRRVKLKKINEELRKIEDVRDILFPASHDLFSFLEKEENVV